MPEKKDINVSPLPVTVKDIAKHPLPSMLLVCLVAISALYLRAEKKSTNVDNSRLEEIKSLKMEVKQLRTEVSFLQEQARRSDSALADVRATLKTLKEYRIITQ